MSLYKIVNEYTEMTKDEGSDVFMFFVKLSKEITDAEKKALKVILENHKGDFAEMNPFDGKEHSYIEIGAWIGDQQMALRLMGLGELLGFWKVMHPRNMMPFLPVVMQNQMAGQGRRLLGNG